MALYALEWRFTGEREARLAVRPLHRAFLGRLRSEGRLVAAGPWSDDSGALIILTAESVEEADRMLEADPYLSERVGGEHCFREWRPFIGGTIDAAN